MSAQASVLISYLVTGLFLLGWMVFGFWLASRIAVWASAALTVVFELFTLAMIRDNLSLNILMLVWPVDAVRLWQAGG